MAFDPFELFLRSITTVVPSDPGFTDGTMRIQPYGGLWILSLALSVLFFLPPGALLWRSRKTGDDRTRLLIRDLAGASLGLTLALLVANFLSVLGSSWLGTVLNVFLNILTTPMVASGYWALSIFLWAFLFISALKK